MRGRNVVVGALSVALAAFGMRPAGAERFTVRSSVSSTDSLSLASALAKELAGARPPSLRADEWQLVRQAYGAGGGTETLEPLWLDGTRYAARARELLGVLAHADSLGLVPNDYAPGEASRAVDGASDAAGPAREALLAHGDVLLTARFVALLDDLLTGRVNPRSVESGWHIATNRNSAASRIRASIASIRQGKSIAAILAELRPGYGVYPALVDGLSRYRRLAAQGGWAPLGGSGTLQPGDTAAAVATLRSRLAAEGYLPMDGAQSDTMDAALSAAVAAFQQRHGLVVDSIVGPRTRRALDVPVERRIAQIRANLERLRWLPTDLGSRFIVVNIPAFTLYGYVGDERTLTMRVVVGDELVSRHTPIFADTMEYVQFGPYWNVPRSIAVNEILPRARRDRSYLTRNHFQIVRGWGDDAPVVDPSNLSNAALYSSTYRVRQLPGPDNALGRVKFMFPNDFNVYLHDTPAKTLFEDANRAHSHGCVRVAEPAALAEFVLHDRADWSPERIRAALVAGRRVRATVRPGIPVYLVYLTAFVRDGEVAFRDDIYDRDDALIAALGAARK